MKKMKKLILPVVIAVFCLLLTTAVVFARHTPVTLCHKAGDHWHTITVDNDAVPGHLGHGDYLGQCTSSSSSSNSSVSSSQSSQSDTSTTSVSSSGTSSQLSESSSSSSSSSSFSSVSSSLESSSSSSSTSSDLSGGLKVLPVTDNGL